MRYRCYQGRITRIVIFRTFKFVATAFSDSGSVNLEAEFCGQVVHRGLVLAKPIKQAITRDYASLSEVLFSAKLPVDNVGHLPLRITVYSGALFFGDVLSNYTFGFHDMWERPDLSFNTLSLGKDCKKNININDTVHEPGINHCWYYRLVQNQTLTCDIYYPPTQAVLKVPPGYANGVNLVAPDPLDL